MLLCGCDRQTELPVEYRGPNAAEHFLEALQEEERKTKTVLANPNAMRMTRMDWRTHNSATTCHVCEKPLEGDSARDHCHITGKYRGAAQNACNLKLRLNLKTTAIPVVFHKVQGYDSHLLIQATSKVEGRISCIPNNKEKYISFSLGQLRFIDSAQFLPASLDKLVAANNTSLKRFRSLHGMNRPAYAQGSLPIQVHGLLGALCRAQTPPTRKPFSASFQTSTSAMRSTGTHFASGRFSNAKPWGTTTISTTAATSYSWQMSSRHFGRPA